VFQQEPTQQGTAPEQEKRKKTKFNRNISLSQCWWVFFGGGGRGKSNLKTNHSPCLFVLCGHGKMGYP